MKKYNSAPTITHVLIIEALLSIAAIMAAFVSLTAAFLLVPVIVFVFVAWRIKEKQKTRLAQDEKLNEEGVYEVHVPFIDDMGSIAPFYARGTLYNSALDDALWVVNGMRDHDGLEHLETLPVGTVFTKVPEELMWER